MTALKERKRFGTAESDRGCVFLTFGSSIPVLLDGGASVASKAIATSPRSYSTPLKK